MPIVRNPWGGRLANPVRVAPRGKSSPVAGNFITGRLNFLPVKHRVTYPGHGTFPPPNWAAFDQSIVGFRSGYSGPDVSIFSNMPPPPVIWAGAPNVTQAQISQSYSKFSQLAARLKSTITLPIPVYPPTYDPSEAPTERPNLVKITTAWGTTSPAKKFWYGPINNTRESYITDSVGDNLFSRPFPVDMNVDQSGSWPTAPFPNILSHTNNAPLFITTGVHFSSGLPVTVGTADYEVVLKEAFGTLQFTVPTHVARVSVLADLKVEVFFSSVLGSPASIQAATLIAAASTATVRLTLTGFQTMTWTYLIDPLSGGPGQGQVTVTATHVLSGYPSVLGIFHRHIPADSQPPPQTPGRIAVFRNQSQIDPLLPNTAAGLLDVFSLHDNIDILVP